MQQRLASPRRDDVSIAASGHGIVCVHTDPAHPARGKQGNGVCAIARSLALAGAIT